MTHAPPQTTLQKWRAPVNDAIRILISAGMTKVCARCDLPIVVTEAGRFDLPSGKEHRCITDNVPE